MSAPTAHQVQWVAAGLRQAAGEAGVLLPISYSRAVAADGLGRGADVGVTRLGRGVVFHTHPGRPLVLGYADPRGQWYRDGRRHTEPAAPSSAGPGQGVPL